MTHYVLQKNIHTRAYIHATHGMYSRKAALYLHQKTCSSMCVVAFFVIEKTGKNLKVHWQEYVNTSVNLHYGILHRNEHEWATDVYINGGESQNVECEKQVAKE